MICGGTGGGGGSIYTGKEDGGEVAVAPDSQLEVASIVMVAIDPFEFWLVILYISDRL